jgi:hypothetical protein
MALYDTSLQILSVSGGSFTGADLTVASSSTMVWSTDIERYDKHRIEHLQK